MSTRLNKLLAERGIGARRKCDEIIQAGRVRVNGVTVSEPGTQIEEGRDKVTVDGKGLQGRSKLVYYVINKPVGVITTLDDPHGRRSIAEFLPRGARVFPVGRLDADTSGLLLLTNDGELAHKLMHPRYGVEKFYRVRLEREPNRQQLERLKRGVRFDEGLVSAPARVRRIDPGFDAIMIEVAIHEGRFRQVRKMCEAVGLTVTGLHRVGYGPVRLGPLARGMYRELSEDEVERLRGASARPKGSSDARYGGSVPRKPKDTGGMVPGSGMSAAAPAPAPAPAPGPGAARPGRRAESAKPPRPAPERFEAADEDDDEVEFEETFFSGGMVGSDDDDLEGDAPARGDVREPADESPETSDAPDAAQWPVRPSGRRGDAAWLSRERSGGDADETPPSKREVQPARSLDEGDDLREAFAPLRSRAAKPDPRASRGSAEPATSAAPRTPKSTKSTKASQAPPSRTARPERAERPERPLPPERFDRAERDERAPRQDRELRGARTARTAGGDRGRREAVDSGREAPPAPLAPPRGRGDAKRDRKRGPGPRPNAGRGEKFMREGKVSSDRPFARFERAGSRPDPARGSRPRRDEMAAARESAAPRPHRGAIPIDPARDPGDRRGPRTQRGGVSGRDHSGRATTRATETARLERWYGSVPQARTRRPGDTRERRVAAPKDERDPRRRRDTSGPGTTTRPRREERAGAGAKVTIRTSARGGRSYEGAPRREERPGRASAAGAARAAGAGRTTQRQERSGSVRTSNPRRGTPAAPARRPSGRPTKRSGGPRR